MFDHELTVYIINADTEEFEGTFSYDRRDPCPAAGDALNYNRNIWRVLGRTFVIPEGVDARKLYLRCELFQEKNEVPLEVFDGGEGLSE